MIRSILGGLLVAALLAGAPGVSGAAVPALPAIPAGPWTPPAPEKMIEVTGVLVHDTHHSPHHFELNNYVLLGLEEDRFEPLVGRVVVVKGTLLSGMSLYMRPVIQVREITPKDAVSIPADPPHRILFGRLEQGCEQHLFLVEGEHGSRTRLEGISLEHLVGQPVAISAEEEVLSDGARLYRVYEALSLTVDLAPYLGSIYQRPATPVQVMISGQPVVMDQAPIMANGRTLVELRAIAEAMGAPIEWNGESRQVTVRRGNRQVVLHIGSPQVIIREGNAETITFATDVAPVLVGGRTMVPIRVLADGLGLKVRWDATDWAVQIS